MDRTNESATGYTYGGQQYKKETRTDSQGNNYTVDVPTAISTAQLSQVQPLQLPTQPASPNYSGVISNAVGQVGQSSLAAQAQADALAQQEAQNQGSALSNLMAQTQAQVGNKASDVQSLYQSSGVNDLAAQLRKLNAQAQGLQLEAQAIPLQEQNLATGQNITTAAVQRNATDRLRDNAIKALSIAQQSAVAQADYATAKDLADQQIAIKYDALENDLKVKQLQLQALDKYVLTPAQEKAKESRAAALQAEQTAAKIQRETENAISDVGMTLRKYGVADNVVKDVLSSKSVNEALLKAGNNLQDPKGLLEMASLKADIALKQAQARKADREAQLTKEPTAAEKKAAALAVTQAQASRQAAQDKIEAVDSILSLDTGIASRVGPSILTRGIAGPTITGAGVGAGVGSVVPGFGTVAGSVVGGVLGASKGVASLFSGQGQQVSGAVHQLTAGLTLKELTDAKANGATFGALSDGERSMLAAAATKLNDWEVKDDKGNPTGYWNIDEKSFKQELKVIQDLNKKALLKSQGTLISPDESSQLDSMFQTEQPSANQYYQ